MCYKQRTKHCVVNRLHLYKLRSCPSHLTPHILCSHQSHNLYLVIPHHDHQDHVHFQPRCDSHRHTFLFHKHPLPDLHSRIRRLRHPFLFPVNERIPKPLSTCAFFTSMDIHLNLVRSKTRSLGSCHICKPAWREHGKNTSWLKYLKRLFGTTRWTTFCKKFNDSSATLTNVQQCP